MCGIVGYVGRREATDVLLSALAGLEYRGYDSAGVSLVTEKGLRTIKAKGRLQALIDRLAEKPPVTAHCGIGHTRWATHGAPSDENAHPHATEKLSLVHNGIIENEQALRNALVTQGYQFVSQTDTEAAAKLLDSLYSGDPLAAIAEICVRLQGAYAFAILFADRPGEIYAVRLGSPLIAAQGKDECFLASDVPAILPYTRDYCLIEEEQIVRLTADGIALFAPDGTPLPVVTQRADWSVEQAQKGGYDHFMRKEMQEQPRVLVETVHPRLLNGLPDFSVQDRISPEFFHRFSRISIVACGTAWHAGMLGRALIEKLARIPVECEIASEFRYRDPILDRQTLVILISQSGETADTLAALRLAKERGATTLAIVNVTGSSIAREADHLIRTFAGPEISVASTKAYTVQLGVLYLLATAFAVENHRISVETAREIVYHLCEAPAAIEQTLALSEQIKGYVARYRDLQDLFFLGRGLDYLLAMEGSLKLKEISYLHCEAYAAGELKHGTISLITPGVPVIAIATQSALLPKTISNVREAHARGAVVLLIAKEGFEVDPSLYESRIDLPAMDDLLMPLAGIAALQLLAYHTAVLRGCDVDMPRNLAKSVTVE